MNSRTLTAGVVACALAAVAAVVALGGPAKVKDVAAAMPYPMPATSLPAPPPPARVDREDTIQIALWLDTSEAMAGSIDQARTQLWQVVGEYARATRHGRHARVEVALHEYGHGAPRQVLPWTDDLDRVVDTLFALTTKGGGASGSAALLPAIEGLGWSRSPDDLRLVFIAGGGVPDETAAIAAARAQGVSVTVLPLGDEAPVAAPQDDELARLRAAADEQGCLPDAAELARLPFDVLPPEARLLSTSGLVDYVDEKRAESERLAARIEELSAEREELVQPWREATAGDALLDTVHDQGAQAGYRFE